MHYIIASLVLGLMLLAGTPAHAIGRLAEISIIDRDSGAVLTPSYYHGEYWVAGTPGARYAIRVRNRRAERLLAVTSVDGLNVLTGANAGYLQTGYVFAPEEAYDITGWRKSDSAVAAFTFADPGDSYAARTGRAANLGVIGVAIYRERPREVLPLIGGANPSPQSPAPRQSPAPSRAPTPSTDANAALRAQEGAAAAKSAPDSSMQAPLSAPLAPGLGTGHGEREYSYVSRTDFTRLRDEPDEIIRIRYDRLDNLVALGVIRRPHPIEPAADPFPASSDAHYVPDPPG